MTETEIEIERERERERERVCVYALDVNLFGKIGSQWILTCSAVSTEDR